MDLRIFFKQNREEKTTEYPASRLFKNENGEIIKWKLRKPSVEEMEDIRANSFTMKLAGGGSPSPVFDSKKYQHKLVVASVVEPNLNNAELLKSYGKNRAEDVVPDMFDNIGEYDKLINFITKFAGIRTLEEDTEDAKN